MAASTAEHGEHDEIHGDRIPEPKAVLRLLPCRHDPLDEQEFPVSRYCIAAVPEGDERFIVPPADEEVGKDMR